MRTYPRASERTVDRDRRRTDPGGDQDASNLLLEDGNDILLEDGGFLLLDYYPPGPSLLLDFAKVGFLDPRITFTRASSGTYFDQNGVLQTAAAGVARFDHDPSTGEALGLLIEEQRTNLCLDSEDLAAGNRGSNTGWYGITRASITSNTVVAPDGTLTGDKVVANTDNNTHFAANRTTAGSTTNTNPITFSGYLKAGELTKGSFLIVEGTTYARNSQVYFDLSAGTVTTPSTANGAASASATITPVGNGWYRCTLTVTLGGTDTRVECRVYPTDSTTTQTFTGNDFDGIYAWGFQIEAGAFATSYIKTTTASVTRNADAASMTGTNFSSWYNQSEGTFQVSFMTPVTTPAGIFPTVLAAHDGTTNNRIALTTNQFFNCRVGIVTSGTSQSDYNAGSFVTANNLATWNLAYKVNDQAASANGDAVVKDTSVLIPTVNQLGIGNRPAGQICEGYIKRIAYYPQRLTDAELQAFTS
jgi:hypothetical protein